MLGKVTYVAAMTTSSVVTGWVLERSWFRLSLRSTAALWDRGLGTPLSDVFSSSYWQENIKESAENKHGYPFEILP